MSRHFVAAALLAAAASPAFATDVPLPNGSFETDSAQFPRTITNWSSQFAQTTPSLNFPIADSVGTFSTFGSYTALNGSNFALINNLGAGVIQLQSAIFPIQNNTYLNFGFIYITNADPSTNPLDTFRVTVDFFSDSGGTTQLLPSLNFTRTPVLALSNIGTVTQTTPLGTTGNLWASSTSGFVGTTVEFYQYLSGFARVSFVIDNQPANSQDTVTAVLIDNVYINPEPGTIALFGLGAAGLGAFAWRRRRARAAAKKS